MESSTISVERNCTRRKRLTDGTDPFLPVKKTVVFRPVPIDTQGSPRTKVLTPIFSRPLEVAAIALSSEWYFCGHHRAATMGAYCSDSQRRILDFSFSHQGCECGSDSQRSHPFFCRLRASPRPPRLPFKVGDIIDRGWDSFTE
jgi:hypothetical protein